MDLNNSYVIRLSFGKNYRKILTQVIEAENADIAIKKAQNTFHFRLYGSGYKRIAKEFQKCCPLTIIRQPLRFGFCGGWTTIHPENDTIFSMLKKACKSDIVQGREITEITKYYEKDYE